MNELEKMIQNALLVDVDLSEEEYQKKILKADESTEAHGITKKAPVSEAKRHKRIEMNFYGLTINYLANILGEIVNTNRILLAQNEELKNLIKEKSDGGNARTE